MNIKVQQSLYVTSALCKDLLSPVFGPGDSYILNFEFYVFVFGLYCFGLAHYRGRVGFFRHTYFKP